MKMRQNFELLLPKKIIFGAGSVKKVGDEAKNLGGKNAVIVVSRGMRKREGFKELTESLNRQEIGSKTVCEVEPEPKIEEIYNCIKTAEAEVEEEVEADCGNLVIGLGGGSVLDVAKKVAADLGWKKIMIPTTAGTGSEVTHEAVLKVEGRKRAFVDELLTPDIAIVDPNLMKTMPPRLVASSGIDALAHSIECYDSKRSNFLVKTLASDAYKILKENLRKAVEGDEETEKEGKAKEEAMEKMALGSLMAGMAFGNSGTALAHALSYPLSNEGIPHGEAVAMVLPYALEFNGFDASVIKEVKRIIKDLRIGRAIKTEIAEMAEVVMQDEKHLSNNPREVRFKDVVQIYENLKNEN